MVDSGAYWAGAFTGEAHRRAREDADRETAWAKFQREMEEEIRKRDVEIRIQSALKRRALEELQKLDPNNPLLDQQVRLKIAEEIEPGANRG